MPNLHVYYDQLTPNEKEFVDVTFGRIFRDAGFMDIPLHGNDDAEVAVDALARLVFVSRKK